MRILGTCLLGWLGMTAGCGNLAAQVPAPGALSETPLGLLSERSFSALGQAAVSIRPKEWKHAETKNFVYHYFQSFVATPVSVEAEFYYTVIAKELGKDTAQWERKCHIFVFEEDRDWAEFQKRAALDPWTGGIHSGNELFIQRNPALKFKGDTLGHEVAHLVVHRFFGPGVPLWLNEGYAQFAAARGYAAFYRARGYLTRPQVRSVNPEQFLPLPEILNAVGYPLETNKVETFYHESQRLVRFLSGTDKAQFLALFEALSHGARFETALGRTYGTRFGLEQLQTEFKQYATKEHGTSIQD